MWGCGRRSAGREKRDGMGANTHPVNPHVEIRDKVQASCIRRQSERNEETAHDLVECIRPAHGLEPARVHTVEVEHVVEDLPIQSV